jgi:hypothetical protein
LVAASSGCSTANCNPDAAKQVVRGELAKDGGDADSYILAVAEKDGKWVVEAKRRPQGTGGESHYAVDKSSCKIVDALRYQ